MIDRKDASKEMARTLGDFVNGHDRDDDRRTFTDEMSCQHRTLQQNFTRLCVAWLEHLGMDVHKQFDARNEASVMLGREFVETIPLEKRTLPYI